MSETCSACTLVRPCPSPAQSAASPGVGGATSDRYGLPPITRSTLTNVPCPLPRRIETGACVDCFPVPRGLPRYSGGSASATSLSRPAQASLALRPTGSLNRPRRPLSQGSGPFSCPEKRPLASYQINRQLSGWNLPPLVLRAVGAHRIKQASFAGADGKGVATKSRLAPLAHDRDANSLLLTSSTRVQKYHRKRWKPSQRRYENDIC